MQVFKTYIRILGRVKGPLILYMSIFFILAIFFSMTFQDSQPEVNFSATKTKIAFVNHDGDSALTKGLEDYLNENTTMVQLADNKKTQQDALFFREIEYLVKAPAGFGENLLSEKPIMLEKTTVPGSISGVYLDLLIDQYLNTVRTYHENLPASSEVEIADFVKADMEKSAKVTIKNAVADAENMQSAKSYFNFFNYAIWMIMIFGITSTMTAFSKTDVRRRNLASPINPLNLNLQLIIGNLFFMIAVWLVIMIPSFILHNDVMTSKMGPLLILNSLIFSIATLSFSYLIALLVKGPNAMNAVANIIGLGTSFISGAFVPQSMLSGSVLFASSFTPSYWFVGNNERILSLSDFGADQLGPVFSHMAIILGFAAVGLVAALVTAKYKRT